MRTFCTDFYNKFMENIQLGSRIDTNQPRLDRDRIGDRAKTRLKMYGTIMRIIIYLSFASKKWLGVGKIKPNLDKNGTLLPSTWNRDQKKQGY